MKANFNPAPTNYLDDLNTKRSKLKRRAYALLALFLIISVFGAYSLSSFPKTFAQTSLDDEYYVEEGDLITDEGCNILGISLYGTLGTYGGDFDTMTSSNYVRDMLEEYGTHPNIQAIVVDVDSAGGSPVAGDEMLQMFKEQTIPVVAYVRGLGASAAYMAILSADKIFVHPYGSVGSIGVISTFYDYSEYNKNEGIKYVPVKSSPGKDAGTPDRPLTEDEKNWFQQEVNQIYDGFVDTVAEYRQLTREQVLNLANGKTYLASVAAGAGLVDEVGGLSDVKAYLQEQTGVEPVICWINGKEYTE